MRVASLSGGFDDTYPLPASAWKYKGKVRQGKGARARAGRVRLAVGRLPHLARVIV